eukprot:12216798-Alexandrium_andersonii.AAC.1
MPLACGMWCKRKKSSMAPIRACFREKASEKPGLTRRRRKRCPSLARGAPRPWRAALPPNLPYPAQKG